MKSGSVLDHFKKFALAKEIYVVTVSLGTWFLCKHSANGVCAKDRRSYAQKYTVSRVEVKLEGSEIEFNYYIDEGDAERPHPILVGSFRPTDVKPRVFFDLASAKKAAEEEDIRRAKLPDERKEP